MRLFLKCFISLSLFLLLLGATSKFERRALPVKIVEWDWLSSAGGAVDDTTVNLYTGKIIAAITDPHDTEALAPADSYDVAIYDNRGWDVLLGAGADRDSVNVEYLLNANLGAVSGSKLSLSITNAGDANQGKIILWIK